VGPVTVEEARRAKEVMLVGSGVLVMPVVEWDGRPVNDGERAESGT
jgi:4-amino-4-deoxychorismate lyase